MKHGLSPLHSPNKLNRKYFRAPEHPSNPNLSPRYNDRAHQNLGKDRDEWMRKLKEGDPNQVLNQYKKEREAKHAQGQAQTQGHHAQMKSEKESKERSQRRNVRKEEADGSICNEGTVCSISQIRSRICFSSSHS